MLRLIPILAALALLTALTGCWRSVSWHQKLTLVVDTSEGEATGSSVVAVSVRYLRQSIGNEVEYDLTGEATVVEVAPGKYLFALLGGSEERFHAAAKGRFASERRGDWLFEIPKQTQPVELFPDHMPMLVTFKDITDPKTVELVDPFDLSASFGPGVSLKAVTLEITKERVTEGRVEEMLEWLTWTDQKWQDYACSTYGCNDNPIRLLKPDGRYRSLVSTDFVK